MKTFNYKYVVVPGSKVIAISSYAGRPVRGIAKCHPNDVFDVKYGKELAAARCNEKIAMKRYLRAVEKYDIWCSKVEDLTEEFKKVCEYRTDAKEKLIAAREKLVLLIGE